MKTVTETKIKAHLDELEFGFWDKGAEEFIPITIHDYSKAAQHFKCSEELVQSIFIFADFLRDYLKEDLTDIWKRLNEIESANEK